MKVSAGTDEFFTEKFADRIGAILDTWSVELLNSPGQLSAIAQSLSGNMSGTSFHPTQSRPLRSTAGIEIRKNTFSSASLSRESFLRDLRQTYASFTEILTAEFQITQISASSPQPPATITTDIRYEIVASGSNFHREQRIGTWHIIWQAAASDFRVTRWTVSEESQARARLPIYADITAEALGANPSYSAQLQHGTDYWRTILDGACGIDIYGHNGVSVADVDNDGFDEIYVCQPAGLPNRLYRNRGDGTFEDITNSSGLGILENTACALFGDFNNDGFQDAILVRASGPLLFVNDGHGKFRLQPDAFRFANPPQGTFTGAAVADYDRDGWLDIYFCLYAFYQGAGQYKYPSPYHNAENGPPNFLMCNHRDGTFRDVTAETGLSQNNTRYSFCCGWSDYNRDGWPDLYVVNDFGRKNLYRNNGDGTFTDVASDVGAEDTGAGMSVCWSDFDNDGNDDLYVANMWTAAGVRISAQDIFKPQSSPEVRSLYRKHAMGNSLFRNRGQIFENVSAASGASMGRWSWSSDAFDFDHDGWQDIYVTNGMVAGPLHDDLNSFFWRQVVARSPDTAQASKDYEAGWNAINELIRSDSTWSGYERNVFYANNHDGTFSDISALANLDFIQDGRSFALADLNHDGRLEVILKNRDAPQLRILQNVIVDLPPSISFRLRGTKSNRDAIGAVITIHTTAGSQTRTLQAGSGFLSQHGKEIFFGLGEAKGNVSASIRWPSGLMQELHDLPPEHRISVEEGVALSRAEPFAKLSLPATVSTRHSQVRESLPTNIETWLLSPYPAPEFSLPEFSGRMRSLSAFRGEPVLLYIWTSELSGLDDLKKLVERLHENNGGLTLIAVQVPGDPARNSGELQPPVVVLRGSEDFAAIYNILYRQLFDRHRDLTLPTAFLVDATGNIVKVYQGAVDKADFASDLENTGRTDAERLARALPFSSPSHTLNFGRNYLSYGASFFQRGYLDPAETAFQQALRDDPSSAEALYGIGSVYLNQNKNATARECFERAVKLRPNYPDTLPDSWNNLGVIATRENRMDDAIQNFQHALQLNPRHLLSLDNLGNAYRMQKRYDDARRVLDRALDISPEDPEANYSIGMVYAQTDDASKAYDHLQRALKARPVYPEALNNLGILYLITDRLDQAVATFQECIRVAPAFDQAYLNLAKLYALEAMPDKARTVLQDLLKQHPDHQQAKQMLNQLQ